ncbi:hypothetical protein TR75_09460 [Hydrogenibacillus schlegelii]|nr:hypothetical protein TR75_09460 [Hydrogenibacillus schlegelii]
MPSGAFGMYPGQIMPGQIWGWIIALYLFLAGMSAGAYTTAYLSQRLYPHLKVIRWSGYIVAPPLVIIGLVTLMIDAEAGFFHPWRFFFLYIGNPSSIMAIGVYILTLFTPLALYRAVVSLAEIWRDGGEKKWPLGLDRFFARPPEWLRWFVEGRGWIDFLGLVMAVATATYTALLIGNIHAVPFWNNSILPVLFVVSAFSTGIAITLFTATAWDPKVQEHYAPYLALSTSLKGLELFLLFALLYFSWYGDQAAKASTADLLWGRLALPFWILLVVLGLALPLRYELQERKHLLAGHVPALAASVPAGDKRPVDAGSLSPRLFATSQIMHLFAIVGGFVLRYLILLAGHFVYFLPTW